VRTPFHRALAITYLAAAVVAMAAACASGTGSSGTGGGSGAARVGDDFDRCGLVTKDRASQVLGMPVATAKSDPIQCQYDNATGTGRLQITLQIPPDGPEQTLANQRELVGPTTAIDGLGDEAFRSGPSTMPTVAVRKGKYVLNVMLYFTPPRGRHPGRVRPDTQAGRGDHRQDVAVRI
jgi:hypothetical protein